MKSKFNRMLKQSNFCFQAFKDEMPIFKFGDHKPLHSPLTSGGYTKPKLYPMAQKYLNEFREQIKIWPSQDIIAVHDRNCKFETPILPVPKKDGTTHYVIRRKKI